ncbi:MAG: SHIRT domain-containing protein [Coriobacteriia bacterium]|nr:SHIRT domain-containing protein [Coriobacteriia bacterium]
MALFCKDRTPGSGEPNTKGKVTAVALSALMLTQTFGAVVPAYANTVGGSSEDESAVEADSTTVDDNAIALTSLNSAQVLRASWGFNEFIIEAEIENADVAYFAYHCEKDTQGVTADDFTQAQGKNIIENFYYKKDGYDFDGADGYVLFFIKPDDGYLLTDIGVDRLSNGDFYSLQDDTETFENIKDYPGLSNVVTAAKTAGYIGVFGWSRKAGSEQPNTVSTSIKGQSPDLTVTAKSDKTTGVKPGDTLTFTVTLAPQKPVTQKDVTVSDVKVNSATVNGESVTVSNLTRKADGTYVGTVSYKVSQDAYDKGTVTFAVNASTTYSVKTSMKAGSSVTTTTTITKDASCDCQVASKAVITYKFVDADGKSVPDAVNACLPTDDEVHYVGDTVYPASPKEQTVKVSDGTWTFKGWDHDSATMTKDGVTFTGTWEFASDNASDHIVLTGKDASKVYDGAALAAGTATAKDDNGYAVTVEYQKADGTWTTNPTDITAINVSDTKTVNVRAFVDGHYTGYVTTTQSLTVTKRSVVLTSASAEKTYNGKALTNNKVTVSGDGFVSGQGATYSVTGSQTEVGESKNTFTYTLNAGTDANNYDVKTVLGTLKVTKADDVTPSKKDDGKKASDSKDNGSAAKKSATPKTGDALLANEAIAAIAGTGVLGVVVSRIRRKK